MSHLSTERLAALVDEQPSADEKTHLTHCADCARELEAHRSVVAMAGSERDAMQLPLTRWETLSHRLRTEGLITEPNVAKTTRGLFERRAMLQVAAALLLVAGGVVLGRFSAGASAIPGGMTDKGSGVSPAASAALRDSLPSTFASIDEANRWRSAYADAYQRTVTFLAENDSAARQAETPAVMRARLSAMDRVSRTMREALNDAPYDPVINDFYLNSFGQREATLRQLNTVLPQGVRLNSF
jgi:hypothetical protein